MTGPNQDHVRLSQEGAAETAKIPMVIDMDGTFTRSDTLHEALLGVIAKQPAKIFTIMSWLKEGKAAFKAKMIELSNLDVTVLPLRQEVQDLIQVAKDEGRTVFLVSASHQTQVTAVAEHVDLFDEAVGSDDALNLAGTAKANWLVERFGEKGFDYVGDSTADLSVWPHARTALSVGASAAVRSKLDGAHDSVVHLDDKPDWKKEARVYLKAMRPHQWLKNLLVFVPALAAHNMGALVPSVFAFMSFCLAASSIYVINDLLDLEVDRRHPRKRNRPFASGAISVKNGLIQSGALMCVSFILALFVQPMFLLVLLGYVILTFAYSLLLKRKQMIDIWTLGTLYTTRIIAGGAATGVMLSEWLLAFSMFIFLSLAAVKRQSELADLAQRGLTETDGRDYRVSDLPVLLGVVLSAGYCSVLVLALYVSSTTSSGLYSEPRLFWLVCAILLYWISRAAIISHRGEMDDDPIVFAIKDRVSQIIFAVSAVLIVLSATI